MGEIILQEKNRLVLEAIADSHPHTYNEVEKIFDRLKSYDKTIVTIERMMRGNLDAIEAMQQLGFI